MNSVSFFFFFSSRRRHTRYWRDWSSDVCSSDLGNDLAVGAVGGVEAEADRVVLGDLLAVTLDDRPGLGLADVETVDVDLRRSEERRVGKECRSRWSPYH